MTTYNTYQEAKIANPSSIIYKASSGNYATNEVFNPELCTVIECNPADHCMRYDDFLTLGHRFVDSDAFLNSRGEVVVITNSQSNNRIIDGDEKRFVLRAAALEDKKPRTKVEYVKCEFDSFSDVYSSILDNGVIYGYEVDGYRPRCYLDESGSFIWRYKERCASHSGLQGVDISKLYRRIETPMTEREEFIDGVEKIGAELTENGDWSFACLAAEIFDRKLVN